VSAPSVGATAVRFPTAIVGIVLPELTAYVWCEEPRVRHYGRQIARSVATVQESLAELARLKAEHGSAVAQKSSAVATVCRNLWAGVRTEFRNAKVLLASEGRMIAKSFERVASRVSPGGVMDAAWRFWKGWLTGEPSPARSAAA
jgi:hypothetical protein